MSVPRKWSRTSSEITRKQCSSDCRIPWTADTLHSKESPVPGCLCRNVSVPRNRACPAVLINNSPPESRCRTDHELSAENEIFRRSLESREPLVDTHFCLPVPDRRPIRHQPISFDTSSYASGTFETSSPATTRQVPHRTTPWRGRTRGGLSGNGHDHRDSGSPENPPHPARQRRVAQ